MSHSLTDTATPTEVVLDVLYLDERSCDPCRAATASADEVAAALAEPLHAVGHTLTVRKIHVTDPKQARALGFVSAPTIRIDGVDIELGVEEQPSASCSALAGQPADCRTYTWQGEHHASPPAEMIVHRVLEHLAGGLLALPPAADVDTSSVDRFLAARIAQATRAAALRSQMRGTVLAAGDKGWEATRATFNTMDDQQPALITTPVDVDDVIAVVTFARSHDLRIVPQCTGHNASPLGAIAGTVLLRTHAMCDVVIDSERRMARVGGGATWADVVPRASELGLAALHGSTPDVSIAGYISGGGPG